MPIPQSDAEVKLIDNYIMQDKAKAEVDKAKAEANNIKEEIKFKWLQMVVNSIILMCGLGVLFVAASNFGMGTTASVNELIAIIRDASDFAKGAVTSLIGLLSLPKITSLLQNIFKKKN
jgi:hypothetical protein